MTKSHLAALRVRLYYSPCVGAIDGAPKCADSSWSLWQGFQGNGFCCPVGLVGIYQSSKNVAGTCVASGQVGTATAARLMSTGTGTTSSTTSTAITATTSTSTTSSPTLGTTSTTAARSTSTKAVFAHYMVGSMTSAEAVTDVQDAMNAGFDGFALNTHTISSSDTWNTNALNYLFSAAAGTKFKLFISFDMSWGLDVTQLAAFLAPYAKQDAYYRVNGQAFISTYTGGTISNSAWKSEFIDPLSSTYGISSFFIPDFDDFPGYPTGVFSAYPVLDGVFSWESAWPSPGTSPTNVSDGVDSAALQEAHAVGKAYMMPLSPFQFKYLGSGQDWYRIGEVNLPERMGQALQLQPDFVEVITWNDAGESHYVGDFWPEQIAGSTIGDYSNGFDHKGWLQIITPFIEAYKAGATSISEISPPSTKPVGTLWYRTLLTSASCSSSIANYQSALNTVNFAVILPSDGYKINIYSNSNLIGTFSGQKGLNYNSVPGLAAGSGQKIEVLDSSNNVVASATGTKNVLAESSSAVCNWNYEVVGLS
ncbi:Glucan endo-1,3-alpha-glucosidase agn1 [Penicillium rolfsii]|nr:Glucan endo-1,3-alpha-glucosidase agn1 [Penicillium rolfsii]